MKITITAGQKKLYLAAFFILLAGLSCAVFIYLGAADTTGNAMVEQYTQSKRYVHGLELYGGKMNVLSDRFCRWFEGLWQGESLAFMIAGIAVVVSFGFAFVAYLLPPELQSGPPEELREDRPVR